MQLIVGNIEFFHGFISFLYIDLYVLEDYRDLSCKLNIYLSLSTLEIRMRFVLTNIFKPSSKINVLLTFQCGASFVDHFVNFSCHFVLSIPCFLCICHFHIWCLRSSAVFDCINS